MNSTGHDKMIHRIFPSIMAKNQQELEVLLQKLKGVARTLHLDVVDGKFAPSHSLDFSFKLPQCFHYHAHLMIKNPERWVKKNGHRVQLCIPQWNEVKDKQSYISRMRRKGQKIAFALNPETSAEDAMPYLNDIDYLLILTVHPGFYGGRFLQRPLHKIKKIKQLHPRVKVIVDGHMNPQTILLAQKAGADFVVSGSFVSKSDNPRRAMRELAATVKK